MTRPVAQEVWAVVPTYGNRRERLLRTLSGLRAAGVGGVVVVDNGSCWAVSEELRDDPWTDVVTVGRNRGSALGFTLGMQRAKELGATYLWLLDDDLVPSSLTLDALLEAYGQLARLKQIDRLAVACERKEWWETENVFHESSFLMFSFAGVYRKVLRRLRPKRVDLPGSQVQSVSAAPYGGLLIHRAVLDRIGWPMLDLVLYADDLEYTWRLSQRGGTVGLVLGARLQDAEEVPVPRARLLRGFRYLLFTDDFRAYYTARNLSYLSSKARKSIWKYNANRASYLGLLFCLAAVSGRWPRLRMLHRAVREGERGSLGNNPEFTLP